MTATVFIIQDEASGLYLVDMSPLSQELSLSKFPDKACTFPQEVAGNGIAAVRQFFPSFLWHLHPQPANAKV